MLILSAFRRVDVIVGVAEVDMARRADQDDRSWWVVRVGGNLVPPSAFMFQPMIMIAFGFEVFLAGRSGWPVEHMIEITSARWSGAGRSTAGDVAGDDEVVQPFGGAVDGAPVVQKLPAEGVGDQSPPGAAGLEGQIAGHRRRDRAVSLQVTGFLVHTKQGFKTDRHLNMRAQTRSTPRSKIGAPRLVLSTRAITGTDLGCRRPTGRSALT